MAEGKSDRSREATAEVAAYKCAWSDLPMDLQHNILNYLPVQELFRIRAVCREWRTIIHRRDFRTVYNTTNSSPNPSPAICYVDSTYPVRLVLSIYDSAKKSWKNMKGFPSLPRSTLAALNARHHEHLPLNSCLYSVGGLLCLHHWTFPRGYEIFEDGPPRGVSSWTVWHPYLKTWKNLPPCRHRVGSRVPFFVHVFISDAKRKTYKILMAHDPAARSHLFSAQSPERKLVTELYDSATGLWTDCAQYTIRVYESTLTHPQDSLNKRGVLCDGVIYFMTGSLGFWQSELVNQNVLLSYDIERDQWREEHLHGCYPTVFEWDGRLMTIKVVTNWYMGPFLEWEPATRTWKDTGIQIPWRILKRFECYMNGFAVVASGNELVVTGYSGDDLSFRIAVYKRAENYWRFPPAAAFTGELLPARVEGLVLHTPRLDWTP